MSDIIGNPLVPTRWRPYTSFTGINRSRDFTALETDFQGKRPQPWWILNNCTVTLQGRIERDPMIYRRNSSADPRQVDLLRFFGNGRVVWVERDQAAKNLVNDRNQRSDGAYALNEVVTMTRVKGQIYIMSPGYRMKIFDGTGFRDSDAPVTPGFGVYIQGRLFVAGLENKLSEVHASRAGDLKVFPENENPDSDATSKAAFIQIQDSVSSSSEIVALGAFEGDRLAIFTEDQALVYRVSTNYTEWVIDARAAIEIGCTGQNSVVRIGQDLVFCSRYGVHVLSRSDSNGLSILPLFLSDDIVDFYKTLVKQTANPREINTFFDPDERMLHVFFPRANEDSIRLSVRITDDYKVLNWSTATFRDMRCGDSLAGDIAFGTKDGVWSIADRVIDMTERVDLQTGERPPFEAITPLLWHGNMFEDKTTTSLMVHAVGDAELTITAYDDQGQVMDTLTQEISYDDQDDSPPRGVPLSFEYNQAFNQTYRGLVLRFSADDEGDLGIIGFAVELKE